MHFKFCTFKEDFDMGKYVEKNLNRNETVVRTAIRSFAKPIIAGIFLLAMIIVTIVVPKSIVTSAAESIEEKAENSFIGQLIESIAEADLRKELNDFNEDMDTEIFEDEEDEKESSTLEDIMDKIVAKVISIVRIPFIIVTLIFFISFVSAIIKYFSTELAITNKRIIGKSGIFSSAALDAPLEKIDSVITSSGLFGKIFGYGNITIKTAAESLKFCHIRKQEEFKRALMAQIDKAEDDRIAEQAKAMAAAVAASNDANN